MKPSGFYLGDCMDAMREFPDKFFDLAIVDPPYGIEIESSGTYFKRFQSKGWDATPPDENYFHELRRVSKNQIIWGGNYFLNNLGNTKCFIIWDKMMGEGMSFADAELAWTSFDKPVRIKRLTTRSGEKIHPTQKPIALYTWLLQNYAHRGDKILDTHVGSASSLIACHRMGFEYWGYELDADYFKAASERLAREKATTPLFEPQEIYKQEGLSFDL